MVELPYVTSEKSVNDITTSVASSGLQSPFAALHALNHRG